MYSTIWAKYLPVIHILLKKSAKEAQQLSFNSYDFEKVGPQKKTGFNFTLDFRNGRVTNISLLTNPAKELYALLLQDAGISDLLQRGDYNLVMNSKFLLDIQKMNIQELA